MFADKPFQRGLLRHTAYSKKTIYAFMTLNAPCNPGDTAYLKNAIFCLMPFNSLKARTIPYDRKNIIASTKTMRIPAMLRT